MAAIVRSEGKILICQRPEGKAHAGKWEFPGGKLEMGETPEAGLARELREELDFTAQIGRIVDARRETESGDFLVLYYEARILSGAPRALEHAKIMYVEPKALIDYEYTSADSAVAAALAGGQ